MIPDPIRGASDPAALLLDLEHARHDLRHAKAMIEDLAKKQLENVERTRKQLDQIDELIALYDPSKPMLVISQLLIQFGEQLSGPITQLRLQAAAKGLVDELAEHLTRWRRLGEPL